MKFIAIKTDDGKVRGRISFYLPHSAELRKAVWLSCKEIWAGSWVTLGISEFSA